ncbi:MAG: TIM barrel protein [bacterium]|nr:TIM barrel protein [bacterium]
MSHPTIKFSMKIEAEASPEELLFAKQLGLKYVYTWVKEHQRSYEALSILRQKVKTAGLTLYNTGSYELGKSDKIHLGLPGRDETIEEFKTFLRNLGRAGIHTTTFTWEPTQVWSSEPGETRGAISRRVDLDEMQRRSFTHGREYSEEEIWDNFEYFIKRILPIAEEANVRLALHPNDPPAKSLGGIPCLIHSFESYKRVFAIADNPYLGMEFCTGCWLEGGEEFGNMLEAIRYFHEQKKIFIVHFRNVSATLPHFSETFLDNGYMDMYQVMKTFCEIGYDGTMILDHTPKFAPGFRQGSGTAYAIGYMRALMERAEAEL